MAHKQSNQNQHARRCVSVWSKILRAPSGPSTIPSLDQKGSALVIGISLLPLLVGAMLASAGLAWFISAKNDLLFQCESGVLQSQKILVEAANTLFQLNSPIKSLVLQKKILQRALILAKTPVEIVAIKTRLLAIEIQLAGFRKQQVVVHRLADIRATRALQQTAFRLKQTFRNLQNLWEANLLPTGYAAAALIQLQKTKIDPSADIYYARSDFAQQQTLTVFGKLSGRSLFPSWIAFLHEENFSWQESCSSRPSLKESKWIAEIGKGKF